MKTAAVAKTVTGFLKYKTFPHPELREGEVCLGNIKENEFFSRRWNPKRMGKTPYDIYGEEIVQGENTSKLRPIFVSQAEVERRERNANRYGSRKRRKKKRREEKGREKIMKEIFVVDGSLEINSVQVPEDKWENESGVFRAQIGRQPIIVQRGGWSKFTTYAGFKTRREAEKFKKKKKSNSKGG